VHAAFASLWGTERLWANVEMGSFKPPWKPGLPTYPATCHAGLRPWFSLGDALPMHWDFSVAEFAKVGQPPLTWEPPGADDNNAAFSLQANLFLNGRGADGGASCVNAGYIGQHAEWIRSADGRREVDRMTNESRGHPRMSNVPGRRTNVAGQAGDLLIFHSMTPHGSSRNTSNDCRLALFFTLCPDGRHAGSAAAAGSDEHAASWREQWHGLGGDELASTALGRRLAGLDPWP
jgi:hypothetical protein